MTFKLNSSEIIDGIGNDLNCIAAGVYSKGIITNAEYQICVNPEASNEESCVKILLQQVSNRVNQDPKNLYTFINILQKMREPTSHYGDQIRKLMKS